MTPAPLCRHCGKPFVPTRSWQASCLDKNCIRAGIAERTRIYRARRAIRLARRKLLENRIHHLPARTQLKLIVIELMAREYVKIVQTKLHSQEPLPQERGAADTLDAVRRLSQSTNRKAK